MKTRTQTKTKKQEQKERAIEWFLALYPAFQLLTMAAFILFAVDQCRG